MKKSHILILTVLGVLIIDQALKIYIKTHFSIGGGFEILGQNWARIHFIENKGMAFGITFGDKCLGVRTEDGSCRGISLTPETGKLTLSIMRLIMISFLTFFIRELLKAKESLGLLISLALILAGAIGNVLDSAFYGLIFSSSPYHTGEVATLFPEGGGYASFLYGNVVDMFYFPMIDTIMPSWVPFVGGEAFQFFRPVFNVADSAIFIGVTSILLFHRSFLKNKKEVPQSKSATGATDSLSAGEQIT